MEQTSLLSPAELRSLWRELAADENSPDHYELTEHGELILSPRATNRHQAVIGAVQAQINRQLGEQATPEASVLTTTAGIRVPDIVWMPAARWLKVADVIEAPELVVEVLSPGNRRAEIRHKIGAYLASGVREVVIVDTKGNIAFHHPGEAPAAASIFGLMLDLPGEYFS